MNKSDGKLKLTFNLLCTGWQNGTCMACFWSFSTLQFNIVCVYERGVRIVFSSVLKNYQHKSIKHPLSPRVQIILFIYPINAIIVDFVALDILAGLVAWCMVYKYYGNIQKAGKFIRKVIKLYEVFWGLNKYINSRDFWYFHKYSSFVGWLTGLLFLVICTYTCSFISHMKCARASNPKLRLMRKKIIYTYGCCEWEICMEDENILWGYIFMRL
jgi:hypothetical protein